MVNPPDPPSGISPRSERTPSPRVTQVSWGHMTVEGVGEGKDFKLYPGGGREWDWNETGTRHQPGIEAEDVRELLDHGAEIVILSRGMELALHTRPETLAYLAARGITVHVKETNEAVALYNELAETEAVGGLFHSTC